MKTNPVVEWGVARLRIDPTLHHGHPKIKLWLHHDIRGRKRKHKRTAGLVCVGNYEANLISAWLRINAKQIVKDYKLGMEGGILPPESCIPDLISGDFGHRVSLRCNGCSSSYYGGRHKTKWLIPSAFHAEGETDCFSWAMYDFVAKEIKPKMGFYLFNTVSMEPQFSNRLLTYKTNRSFRVLMKGINLINEIAEWEETTNSTAPAHQ